MSDNLLGFTAIVDENAEPDTVTVVRRKELDYAARIAELEAKNAKLAAEVAAVNKGAAINAKTNQLFADRVSKLNAELASLRAMVGDALEIQFLFNRKIKGIWHEADETWTDGCGNQYNSALEAYQAVKGGEENAE